MHLFIRFVVLKNIKMQTNRLNNMSTPTTKILLLALTIFVIASYCKDEKAEAEERSIYLVLMAGDPLAFHGGKGAKLDLTSEAATSYGKHLVDSHDQLLQTILDSGSYSKLYSFYHIINGFAVHTTPSQVDKLKASSGVKLVEKDRGAKLMTTYTPQFLELPQRVWTQEGGDTNEGEGVVIGFVDTGINPDHPSFAYDPLADNPCKSNISRFRGACETGPSFSASSCNGKILSARFFSAGAQSVASLNSSVDVLSPFDAVGHGSHVASIAAGNAGVPVVVNGFYYGQASGMAPRARIAVYKAVYPTVGTLADVIAAMDKATMDGVDILTLSVGPDRPPEDSLTFLGVYDIFMLYARRAGIFVVQAAGNQGPGPSTVLSYSPWAVGVAASATDRNYPASLLLGNGLKIAGVGLSGPMFGDGVLLYKLVLGSDALKLNGTFPRKPDYMEECQHPEVFEPDLVRGSIVICSFSAGFYNQTSTIDAIIDTVKTLGCMGFVLIANPSYGDFIAEPIPFAASGIMIPNVADAQVILKYYEQNIARDQRGFITQFNAQAGIGEGRVACFAGRVPRVSRFSSRGPDFIDIDRNLVDVLKPDILAPGHQIWAAWSPLSALDPTLSGYNFALLSGTSMATPHIAGIAAIIKQRNPQWTPSMIASAMATTATNYDNQGEIILAEGYDINSFCPSTYFDVGAGFVNPVRALDPGLVFPAEFEDYIKFLCSLPNVDQRTINNTTGVCCNDSLGHPANLNSPSITVSALKGYQIVQRCVQNVGILPETYLISVLSPNGTTVQVSPTWFRIHPQATQYMFIAFKVTQVMDGFTFGEIVLTGSLNHIVRIALSVFPVSLT